MAQPQQHRLANGLWLVAESLPHVQSLAMTLLLPAGASQEPAHAQGVAAVLAEMVCRGAGDLDARAHSDALDHLGVQRDTHVSLRHLSLSAVMIAAHWEKAFPLLFDMIRRPRLDKASLDPSIELALQALDSLEDEPQDKVFLEVRRRHFPAPFNRSTLGVRVQLEALTHAAVHKYWQQTLVPDGAILAVAGKLDWEPLKERITQWLGAWHGAQPEPPAAGAVVHGYGHVPADSAQLHLGLAYDAPPEGTDDALLARMGTAVLSGGASSRLFTQVREKRGLCYAVSARYGGDRRQGSVFCYAGTTPTRAQETLEVLVDELRQLAQGVSEDEFRRALVGFKSGLVMQGESTSSRATALALDQYLYGRPRALDEWLTRINAIRLDELHAYLRAHPPGVMTVATVGNQELRPPQ